MKKEISIFMNKLREMKDFDRVKFVILFGSQAEGRANKMSDYDFAIYYDGNGDERYKFLKETNFSEKFDAKVFQDLPLFIRKNVLKGKVLYVFDEQLLYDVAYETIKRFDDFRKYYYDYLDRRPIVK
jgi:uncharacterized protein